MIVAKALLTPLQRSETHLRNCSRKLQWTQIYNILKSISGSINVTHSKQARWWWINITWCDAVQVAAPISRDRVERCGHWGNFRRSKLLDGRVCLRLLIRWKAWFNIGTMMAMTHYIHVSWLALKQIARFIEKQCCSCSSKPIRKWYSIYPKHMSPYSLTFIK